MRNIGANVIGAKVTAKQMPPVIAAVKTIFAHEEPDDMRAQWDQVVATYWQEIWSNNPIERLNKEIKRRADVVEIFPNRQAFLRLATAVVIDQHDEWQEVRRYVSTSPLHGTLSWSM